MSPAVVTCIVLGVAVVLFVWNRVPVEIVSLGVALSLYATGVVGLDDALGGFGDQTVVFIAALFVVSEALDATGVTTWLGRALSSLSRGRRGPLLVATMIASAVLTALISVNGAVAALIPMVVALAVRTGIPPSSILMPLAFAAHAGSLLVLTGTPVNLLVAAGDRDAGGDGIGYFEFGIVGVPLLAGTIALAVLFGRRLIPRREPDRMPPDLSALARLLAREYTLHDHGQRLRLTTGSPFVGRTSDQVRSALPSGVRLRGVERRGQSVDGPARAGDVVVVAGPDALVAEFVASGGLEQCAPLVGSDGLIDSDHGVAELVVPPRSEFVGHRVFPGMVTDSGELVVVSIQRHGEDVGTRPHLLAVGDTLLVRGSWDALDTHAHDPDVRVVHDPDLIRRQGLPLGSRAVRALVVVALMVAALATGIVPAAVAALVAAGAMVLTRAVGLQQAHRSISWTTLILVAGMMPMSTAIGESGVADGLATWFVSTFGSAPRLAILAALFVVTAILGQLISNTATALVVIPIVLAVASDLGVSATPMLMTVAVACAASFFTPVATPANLMIQGPAGYRFGDYWPFGSVVMAWFFVVGTVLVPFAWSF